MTRRLASLLITAVLIPLTLPAQAADSPRQRLLMDFGWRFALGDPAEAERANFDDKQLRSLDVPHDWSIEGSWAKDNPSGIAGGFAPIGIGWYRKSFRVPPEWKGQRVFLEFDGVFNRADVWVNGQKVGHNENGYFGFECDLTPWIRLGRDNVIAVRADNLKQASRWYTGSGIYRHVWLTVTDPLHVARHGSYVTTPEISDSQALVKISTTVQNDSDDARNGVMLTRILDPAGNAVGQAESAVAVPPRGMATVTQEIRAARPHLWAPTSPRLYRAVSELRHGHDDQRLADRYETPFGIRTVRFDVNNGFTLNGKRIILKGVNLHHDLGALGAASFEAGYERRLKILMSLGVNAIRLSHNPHSPELLDMADRLGLLIFDEAYDKWYGFLSSGAPWKEDLEAFIRRDRNHPSVIIWSVGNEMTPHMYMREGTLLYQAMAATVRQLDPTRPVTAGLHPVRTASGQRDAPLAELAQYMDVISMNYQTRWYARDHQQHPTKPLLGSETHLHQNPLSEVKKPSDSSGNQWFGTQNYETNEFVPYVAGQFIWAGFDYLGESTRVGWPSKGNRVNLIETTGFPRPFAFYHQSFYAENPMVAIAVDNPDFAKDKRKYDGNDWLALLSHWTFPAAQGTLRVYTFTNAPAVELILNGKSLGEKRLKDYGDRLITWDIPYAPGTLRAIAKKDGAAVANHELKTAGPAVRLVLLADRSRLDASGQDLAHVEVRAVDAAGIVVPGHQSQVRFTISGAGTIAAVDNGDLDSPEPFQGDRRELRGGRALVIVRSSRDPGKILLRAQADGLEDAQIEIETATKE